MHQRHAVRTEAENGSDEGCCHNHPPDAIIAKTSNNKFRKRRKPPRTNRKPFLWGRILDEDWTIALIQIVSGCILTGCGIILFYTKTTGSHNNRSIFEQALGAVTDSHERGKPYPKNPLPSSSYYTIPGSMSHIGDKSDQYAQLRREFDAIMMESGDVDDTTTSQKHKYAPRPMHASSDHDAYDIHNCPNSPPHGYPFAWTLLDILADWPPDDPTPRKQVYQGLCVFDYTKDYQKALTYRAAEVPFVVRNDPQVQKAVVRWNSPNYMQRMLGTVQHRAEFSETNHFLYWNMPPQGKKKHPNNPNKKKPPLKPWQRQIQQPQNWSQPTQMMRMTYSDWLAHANVTSPAMLGPDQPHWYFRLIGCGETGPQGECDAGSSEYLFDELTFFQPKPTLYMVDPDQQKGIHCRFGMKGVIAENHFDGSRNAIVVLGGERRYLLSHPNQCDFLSLWPKGHPSARHSAVDWSDPDLERYPEFALAQANEVVLLPGDVLYLPTNWFHYIISLTLNFQCNTRSGVSQEYMPDIHHCGF